MANFQNFHLSFSGLQTNAALSYLDKEFCDSLPEGLKKRLADARSDGTQLSSRDRSALMIGLAPFLESYLRDKFALDQNFTSSGFENSAGQRIHTCQQKFIRRVVQHDPRFTNFKTLRIEDVHPSVIYLCGGSVTDQSFAKAVETALSDQNAKHIDHLIQYAVWAMQTSEGKSKHKDSLLFSTASFLDDSTCKDDSFKDPEPELRRDFNLCDRKPGRTFVEKHEAQCLICHERDKDTCRTGTQRQNTDGGVMNGCPLDQKISEMIHVHREGHTIGALAIIAADNPLVPLTGRRICGECINSCILHGSNEIDVPTIETHILDSVLSLDFGFEIYALLTRWNPLNFKSPLPHDDSGHTVCVVGQGPAGIGLAYSLTRQGHQVLAIDALPITPIDTHHKQNPISSVQTIWEDLDSRLPGGFGGVAEYGITSRWDKNYLKLVQILLERQQNYQLRSGIRFGSQLQLEDLDEFGVSHVALCLGTGQPNDLKELRAVRHGVHIASDFLMHLNHGAYHYDRESSLWIDLPLVVVGGGLTAFDAASEALIYYRRQLEKFSHHWRSLNKKQQDDLVQNNDHLATIRAHLSGEISDKVFTEILKATGGVTLLYRGRLKNSPAYKTNKPEIHFALKSGIKIREMVAIESPETNAGGQLISLNIRQNMKRFNIAARTVLIATGIQPNTHVAKDAQLSLDSLRNFAAEDNKNSCLIHRPTHLRLAVSQHGDVHPHYRGSVVKALASAKHGAREIEAQLNKQKPRNVNSEKVSSYYCSKVARVQKTPFGHLLTIHSPACVRHYRPGNFFKLQLAHKGVALLPVHISQQDETLTFLIYGHNKSLSEINIGQHVLLMGPVGNSLALQKDTFFYTPETWAMQIAQIASYAENPTICIDVPLNEDLQKLITQIHPKLRIVHKTSDTHDPTYPAIGARPEGLPENAEILTLAPMQCMLKSVCGRCRVSTSGLENPIFACENLWNTKSTIDWSIRAYSRDQGNPWNVLRKIQHYAN